MSTEAEAAAKWKMVEDHKKAKERLVTLEAEFLKLTGDWSGMYRAATQVGTIHFEVRDSQILAFDTRNKEMVGNLTPMHLSWENFKRLTSDLTKTREEKQRLENQIKQLGINLS